MTEADLQAAILDAAALYGWRSYHTHDSRRSAPGFPDLVLVNARLKVALFAELKSEKGKLAPEQRAWLDDLDMAGQVVYLWRPEHLDAAIDVLANGYAYGPGRWSRAA